MSPLRSTVCATLSSSLVCGLNLTRFRFPTLSKKASTSIITDMPIVLVLKEMQELPLCQCLHPFSPLRPLVPCTIEPAANYLSTSEAEMQSAMATGTF